MIFHNLIKEKRQKMSLTQMELANKLLVSNKTISNWETGKTLPDIENIILISKYLNISLDDLFLGDETMVGKSTGTQILSYCYDKLNQCNYSWNYRLFIFKTVLFIEYDFN